MFLALPIAVDRLPSQILPYARPTCRSAWFGIRFVSGVIDCYRLNLDFLARRHSVAAAQLDSSAAAIVVLPVTLEVPLLLAHACISVTVCKLWQLIRRRHCMQGRMKVPHSLFVDDCADAVYVADRDNGAVHRIQIRGKEAGGEHLHRTTMGLSSDPRLLQLMSATLICYHRLGH